MLTPLVESIKSLFARHKIEIDPSLARFYDRQRRNQLIFFGIYRGRRSNNFNQYYKGKWFRPHEDAEFLAERVAFAKSGAQLSYIIRVTPKKGAFS